MYHPESLAPHTGKVFEAITKLECLEHSDHKLRTRGLLNMLTTGSYFIKEKGFEELNPVYQVSSYDIQEYIKERLLESKSESEKGL